MREDLRVILALLFALPATSGVAQTVTQVTGTLDGPYQGSTGSINSTYTCTGSPACTGTFSSRVQPANCSNALSVVGNMSMTLDVSQPAGTLSGNATFLKFYATITHNGDGTCSIASFLDQNVVISAAWNGTTGSFTFSSYHGTFTVNRAAAPPVFPMTIAGGIDAVRGNVTATMNFRPQDIGTVGSVYVFAKAPAAIVKSSAQTGKDTPLQCILAQLNAQGELHAVSASSLQAYVTGVLTAQGQAVTVLNNVPTVNIAGATFYLGYGPDSASMMDQGINRRVITAPGSAVCDPKPPQTGWWWNPAEGGRGFSIESRGNNIFFAAFLYEASGRSTWYVAAGPSSLDGSLFQGTLQGARGGQTLGGAYPGRPQLFDVGSITLSFSDAQHGTMIWPGGAVPIERFNIAPNGLNLATGASQPESGWWWNEAESGRGFFMEWQGGSAFIAAYMYDDTGDSLWYLTQNATPSTNLQSYTGNWTQYANGQTLTSGYSPATIVNPNVAPVTIQFSGKENAVMTLPNGRTATLTRFRF